MTKTQTILEKRPHLIPAFIAALMLFAALGRWPYGYFQLLRWVTCAAAVWVGFLAYGWQKKWATVIFAIVAVLFNPLVPIHLSREMWQPIDFACAVLFALDAFVLKESAKKEQEENAFKRPNKIDE